MFGPNNTMTMKVMSMKEDGEELMVEKRVITEMVYWDMVGQGHPVFTVVDIIEKPDGVVVDVQGEVVQGAGDQSLQVGLSQGGHRRGHTGGLHPHCVGAGCDPHAGGGAVHGD